MFHRRPAYVFPLLCLLCLHKRRTLFGTRVCIHCVSREHVRIIIIYHRLSTIQPSYRWVWRQSNAKHFNHNTLARILHYSNFLPTFSFFDCFCHSSILPFPHCFYIYRTDVNKESPIDYKSGSACSTPTKDTLKSYDRNYSGPVLPPRSTMCTAPAHHYSAPLNFRKGLAAKCSWKCTAIAVILLSAILLSALIFVAGMYKLDEIDILDSGYSLCVHHMCVCVCDVWRAIGRYLYIVVIAHMHRMLFDGLAHRTYTFLHMP